MVVLDVAPTRGDDVGSNGFQQAEGSGDHDISRVIEDFKRDGDVRLCHKIVNLVESDGVEPATEKRSVGEVSVMELHPSLVGVVGVDVDVVDTLRIEIRRMADQVADLISFVKEELDAGGALSGLSINANKSEPVSNPAAKRGAAIAHDVNGNQLIITSNGDTKLHCRLLLCVKYGSAVFAKVWTQSGGQYYRTKYQ
ncbi:hypothetical protein Goari_002481 [Gossypium aridum]|uniref:Uncharacterized protein n=1 Tax=Gossypium aridum TaxID=34290 RepID=A0A7J8YA20_GOSAI|nr:hypothetical protein [Gossypium aridum]